MYKFLVTKIFIICHINCGKIYNFINIKKDNLTKLKYSLIQQIKIYKNYSFLKILIKNKKINVNF